MSDVRVNPPSVRSYGSSAQEAFGSIRTSLETLVSDAVSVIVSEETGQISLAVGGMIVRDIKEESLISKLYEELNPKPKTRERQGMKIPFWKRKGGDERG